MSDQKELLPEAWEEIVSSEEIQAHKIVHPSSHIDYYLQKLSEVKQSCCKSLPNFSEKGVQHYTNVHRDFSFHIVDQFNSYEIVVIDVFIGAFSISMKILNSEHRSPLSKTKSSGEGSYGQVFFVDYCGQTLAVKALPLYIQMNLNERKRILSKAIKQYCISKISSCLQVGPAMPMVSGFDMIFYSNSIQFVLEKCDSLRSYSEGHSLTLLENLGILHKYKIMHMDINPNNVMFSRTLNKIVFIDFGLSSVIEEDQGYESFTFFRGTPQFICKQMLNLFSEDSSGGFVDLYYNDLTSYERTINKFGQSAEMKEGECYIDVQELSREVQSGLDSCRQGYQNECLFLLLKYQGYFQSQNFRETLKAHREMYISMYPRAILKLFLYLLPSSIVEDIVFTQIEELIAFEDYFSLIQKIKYLHETGLIDKPNISESQSDFELLYLVEDPHKEADQKNNQISTAKTLMDQQFFDLCTDKTDYFSKLIACLRFDMRNLDVGIKYEIASCFLGFIDKEEGSSCQNKLIVFQQVFKYLLGYCLTEATPEWRNQNRQDLLLQAVFTDANVLAELGVLQKFIREENSFRELIELDFQLLKICRTLDKKYSFEDHSLGLAMITKVEEMLDALRQNIKQRSEKLSCEELQIADLTVTIFEIKKKLKPFDSSLYDEAAKIAVDSVRYQLTQFLLMVELESYRHTNQKYQYLQLISRARQEPLFSSKLFKRRKFIDRLYWDWFFIFTNKYTSQIQSMANSFEDTINYDRVYHHFIFQHACQNNALLLKMERDGPSLFREQLLTFIQTCFQDRRFSIFLTQVPTFLELFQEKHFRDNNSDLLQKYEEDYSKYCEKEFMAYNQDGEGLTTRNVKPLPDTLWQNHLRAYRLFRYMNVLTSPFCDQYNRALAKQAWNFIGKYARGEDLQKEELFQFLKCEQRLAIGRLLGCQYDYFCIKRQLQMLQIIDSPSRHETLLTILFNIRDRCYRNHFSSQTKKCFEQRMEIIVVWVFEYTTLKNLLVPFYLSDESHKKETMAEIILILLQKGRKQEMYRFLKTVVAIISNYPQKLAICIFNENINSLKSHPFLEHHNFVQYADLKQQFGPISWGNRYCLIIYAFALLTQLTNHQILQILKMIMRNVHTLGNQIKDTVLFFYYLKIEHSDGLGIITNNRKRNFIFLHRAFRLCFRAHPKAFINPKNYLTFCNLCKKPKRKQGNLVTLLKGKLAKKVKLCSA